jgi:putative phosphoribosyl transferase
MGKLFEDPALRNKRYVFKDRPEAGEALAWALSGYASSKAIILAIPAGGVPVAQEMAKGLGLPWDLMLVRKIQIPAEPEAGFGAIGPDGEAVFNEGLLRNLRLTPEEIQRQVEKTREVLAARNQRFRGGRLFPDITGRSVILVDDGLASGFTMSAAARFSQRKGAGKIVVAIPTGSGSAIALVLPLVDELHCLNVRASFPFAVAEAYENWYDLTDAEVIALLPWNHAPSRFVKKAKNRE